MILANGLFTQLVINDYDGRGSHPPRDWSKNVHVCTYIACGKSKICHSSTERDLCSDWSPPHNPALQLICCISYHVSQARTVSLFFMLIDGSGRGLRGEEPVEKKKRKRVRIN